MNYKEHELMLKRADWIQNYLMRDLTDTEFENLKFIPDNSKYFDVMLGWDARDKQTFERLKELLSAYCTGSHDDFEKEISKENYDAKNVLKTIVNALEDEETRKAVKEDSNLFDDQTDIKQCPAKKSLTSFAEYMLGLFDEISNKKEEQKQESPEKCDKFDRVTECEGNCEKCDWIDYLIGRLKGGEELQLSEKEIDEICEKLFDTEDNVHILIKNNKIKLV